MRFADIQTDRELAITLELLQKSEPLNICIRTDDGRLLAVESVEVDTHGGREILVITGEQL